MYPIAYHCITYQSMKHFFILLIILQLLTLKNQAQNPTWSNGVACIIYTHCSSCHNPGGIAPFSLLSYQDVVNHKSSIVYDITKGIMPPYHADRFYQHYTAERYLTPGEIKAITQWVEMDTPIGDTSQTPVVPVISASAQIANPDYTTSIQTYTIPAMTSDLYRCFVISNPFPVDKYISELEVIPGNKSAVHHVLLFQDSSMTPVNLDKADPNPGYTNFGGIGSNSARLIVGWVPGSEASFFPPTMAIRITAGSRLIVQIHYPLGSSGKIDSTRVNLKFSGTSGLRDIIVAPILNHSSTLTNGPLFIPANTIKTFHSKYTLPIAATILTVAPHSHLICQSMKAFAVKPGNDTVHLVKIDNWDFHWQGGYSFRKPIALPPGTVLYGEATYNNTSANPLNPNSPPKNVSLGEATTNEMMLFYFNFLTYQSGDENMIIDTTSSIPMYNNCSYIPAKTTGLQDQVKQGLFAIYPVPVTSELILELPAGALQSMASIYDMKGSTMAEMNVQEGLNKMNVEALLPGLYMLRLTDKLNTSATSNRRFIKQ